MAAWNSGVESVESPILPPSSKNGGQLEKVIPLNHSPESDTNSVTTNSANNATAVTKNNLMDTFILRHNASRFSCTLRILGSSVIKCIRRGHSVAVDGYDKPILTSLLDFVITSILEMPTELFILFDCMQLTLVELANLKVLETDQYQFVTDELDFSKRVSFLPLKLEFLHSVSLNNCILISYVDNGCRFSEITKFNCPFISLTVQTLPNEILYAITKPFRHITSSDCKKVSDRSVNKYINLSPGENQIQSPTHTTISHNSVCSDPRYHGATSEFTPKNPPYMYSECLLKRLRTKYNTTLDTGVCSTMYTLLEEGQSVIIDQFTKSQLKCVLEFIIAKRTFQKVSILETKTLLFHQLIGIHPTYTCTSPALLNLDIIRSNEYSFFLPNGSFDVNKKVLVVTDTGFFQNLKKFLPIDNSYLLIFLSNKGKGRFDHVFNHLKCQFLGLSKLNSISFPKKTFTHIHGDRSGGFEVYYRNCINKSQNVDIGSIEEKLFRDDSETHIPLQQHMHTPNVASTVYPITTPASAISDTELLDPLSINGNLSNGPIIIESLADRLSRKHRCNLDIQIFLTLYEILEGRQSLIIDNFTKPQIHCILDFVFAVRTYKKASVFETKTLFFCPFEWLHTRLQLLDVIASYQYSVAGFKASPDLNKQVLMMRNLTTECSRKVSKYLNVDCSYLLIHFAKNLRSNFASLFNCRFLGMCEKNMAFFPQLPFIRIRGNPLRGFAVEVHNENIPFPVRPSSSDLNNDSGDESILEDPLSIPELPQDIPTDVSPSN